ncbi:hypothetical protein D3C72_871670 [compost metagenome]
MAVPLTIPLHAGQLLVLHVEDTGERPEAISSSQAKRLGFNIVNQNSIRTRNCLIDGIQDARVSPHATTPIANSEPLAN